MEIVTDETGLVLTPQDSKPTGGSNVNIHNASVPRPQEAGRLSNLTRRERQVLELIVSGKSNKEIASHLGGVTIWTAKKHVSAVLHKLHVRSRVSAAVLYARQGASTGRQVAR